MSFSRTLPPNKLWVNRTDHKFDIDMIHFVAAVLKEIFEQGRAYKWQRPEKCLKCGHYKVWGHGFVPRYFDGFSSYLLIKCYRCPCCGCVITLRPDSHFSRFQASRETIRSHLHHRLKTGRWPPDLPRSRQRHWLANLRRKIKAYLTEKWTLGETPAFNLFIEQGQVPVSSVI